jgi:hypothetical protein
MGNRHRFAPPFTLNIGNAHLRSRIIAINWLSEGDASRFFTIVSLREISFKIRIHANFFCDRDTFGHWGNPPSPAKPKDEQENSFISNQKGEQRCMLP